MSDEAHPVTIEYEESHVPRGEALVVHAQKPCRVQILDATPVGSDIRFQYLVIWDEA